MSGKEGDHAQSTNCAIWRALLRVSLGVLFLAHVALKIFVFTVPGTVGFFQSLGLPAVIAYGVMALELLGGIALIIGFYAPYVALPLAAEMVATIISVHGANGWLFTNKGGGWEYPAFWAVALLVLFLLGMGHTPSNRPQLRQPEILSTGRVGSALDGFALWRLTSR